VSFIEPPTPVRPALPVTAFAFIGLWVGLAYTLNQRLDVLTAMVSPTSLLLAVSEIASDMSAVRIIGYVLVTLLASALMFIGDISSRTRFLEKSSRKQTIAFLCAAVMAGTILGSFAMSRIHRDIDLMYTLSIQPVYVCALADGRPSPFGAVQTARIMTGVGKGAHIQLNYPHDSATLELGESACIADRVIPLARSEDARRLFAQGVVGRVTITALDDKEFRGMSAPLYRYRASLTHRIAAGGKTGSNDGDESDGSGLTRALLLGDRRGLSQSTRDDFGRVGLGHILAVSGTHFTVIAACIMGVLKRLPIKQRSVQMIALAVCILFVVATGLQPSAIRALGMLTLLCLNTMLLRRSMPLNSLALAGITCLIINPFWAVSLGFALSVCAVGAIGLFSRYIAWVIRACIPALSATLCAKLGLTGVALGSTLPLTTSSFGYVSLLTPLTNLLLIPVMLLSLTVSLVGVLFNVIIPSFAAFVFTVSGWINEMVIQAVSTLASLRFASISFEGGAWLTALVIGGAIVLWTLWPLPSRMALKRAGRMCGIGTVVVTLIATSVSMVPAQEFSHRVVILDVGQGDAILVQSKQSAVLVDAGPDSVRLRHALRDYRIKNLDALIFTHDHDDHIAGAIGLSRYYHIRQIICAQGAQTSEPLRRIADEFFAELKGVEKGVRILVGDIVLEILGPLYPVIDPSANESCLVIHISRATGKNHDMASRGRGSIGESSKSRASGLMAGLRAGASRIGITGKDTSFSAQSVLISGDAEASSVRIALRDFAEDSSIDVYKIGHHGSKQSLDRELLESIDPSAVIFSVGAENSYGHPAPSIIDLCRSFGARIFRTDENGSISIGLSVPSMAQ